MNAQSKHSISRDDIMPMDDYVKIRKSNKQKLIPQKKLRRISVGPFATFYFENYDTMWAQIHEMLYIERGGEEQIKDELSAYNPLIPNGSELVATMMLEIDDPIQRDHTLHRLGGIEETAYISVAGKKFYAVAEQEVERTTEEGKTSAIHFLHFPFQAEDIKNFLESDDTIMVGIEHANYGHIAVLSAESRAALKADFTP